MLDAFVRIKNVCCIDLGCRMYDHFSLLVLYSIGIYVKAEAIDISEFTQQIDSQNDIKLK